MKKSPQYLRSTLRQAHALQQRYHALGAPTTQNIRNPLPIHRLVLEVLPVLPDPETIVPVVTETRFTFKGKTFTKREKGYQYAKDIVPQTQWQKHGKTVEDVMGDLERKGFIVRSRVSVAMALSQARVSGAIESVRQPRNGKRGKPRSLYFATE